MEDIKEPTMQEIRYLDKLIDELAKGKKVIGAVFLSLFLGIVFIETDFYVLQRNQILVGFL